MNKEDFLQIFKSGFHKLNLKKLVKVGESKNEHGREYEEYLGLFEFVPPEDVWFDDDAIDYDALRQLMKEFEKELSNCIVRKFSRKIIRKNQAVEAKETRYIFDVIPKNIVDFRFNTKSKTIKLVVKGYCLKK